MNDDVRDRELRPRPRRPPPLIGITGPIGCGKSTVGRILGDLGGTVIDADILARRATARGRATLPKIRERFGDAVFNDAGDLDRAAMAQIAFEDAAALAALERIVHPEVRALVDEALSRASAEEAPFVVIEAIKLVEGGLARRCDEIWLIECEPDVQRERLIARGDSEADAARRLQTQGAGLADRLARQLADDADDAPKHVRRLSTDGSLGEVRDRVEDLLADVLVNEDRH